MRKLLIAATALTLASSANAVAFVNGSFEDGVDNGSFLTVAAGDTTSITGWWVGPDGVDYIGTYWQASDGNRSLDMSALSSGQIMQTLSGLTIGKTYSIGFDLSGNPTGGNATRRLTVSATSGTPETFVYTMTAANSLTDMQWQHFTYTFTATSTMQDVQFLSQEQNAFGPALDNLTISAIPEPAAWGLMLFGFGAVGIVARRRTAAPARAA